MENESKIKTLQICRTCMQEITDTSVFFLLDSTQTNTEPTIRQKLSDCIPELDLHITANAVICNKCVDVINIMHKFRKGCLRSEIQIYKYMQQVQHSGDVIDLLDVTQLHQLCMEFKTGLHKITEDFEIKDFQNEDLTTPVCDVSAVKEEDEGTEIVKQEYTSSYSISRVEDSSNKYDKSDSVQNCLLQVVDDQNDKIQNLCKNDIYYECFTCGYKAKSKFNIILHLKIHMRLHTGEKPFKCSICKYTSNRKDHFKIHMRMHTGEKPFKCSICENRFSRRGALKIHIRLHTGEKPFKCSICKYTSNRKDHFKIHMRMHTGEKPFKCSICENRFSRRGALKIHIRLHTGEKPFKCSICKYTSNRKDHFKIHMRMHTGEKPFKCSICENRFSRRGALKIHIRLHTGEKPFKCSICEYSCNEKGRLKRHMCIHTGEKPFKCSICEYSFNRKYHLKCHMRIHTEENPLKCSICKYSFGRKDHLKIHMRIHTGEKPFKCSIL